jgi:hypothetical protein
MFRNILLRIAIGLRHNPSVQIRDLFLFVFTTIEENLIDRASEQVAQPGRSKLLDRKATAEERVTIPEAPLRDLKPRLGKRYVTTSRSLLIAFALHLFEHAMSDKIHAATRNQNDDDLDIVVALDLNTVRSLCDPFVALLLRCAQRCDSDDVTAMTLKTFSLLLGIPEGLPSLQEHASAFAAIMIQGTRNGSFSSFSLVIINFPQDRLFSPAFAFVA